MVAQNEVSGVRFDPSASLRTRVSGFNAVLLGILAGAGVWVDGGTDGVGERKAVSRQALVVNARNTINKNCFNMDSS